MDRRTRGVVAAVFVAQGLGIGATVGAFTLFVRPVADAFSATTLQASAGISLITMTLGVCGVPIGNWLDRGSPRRVMFTGCALLGAGLSLASIAQSLGQLALTCIVCGAAVPMLGPLTTAAVVAKATSVDRGRALGFANLGVPLGGLVFALIGGAVIDASGWRAALQVFAFLVWGIGFVAIYLGVPKDLSTKTKPARTAIASDDVWPVSRLVGSPIFLLIALVLGIGMGTNAGWSSQAASFLHDRGASFQTAGLIVGATQGSMAIGTLFLGSLVDRRDSVFILIGVFATQVACFAVLLAGPNLIGATAALVALGIVAGGLLPVFGHLLAERFGSENAGRAIGLANLALLPFGFGMPMLMGGLRDANGDYQSAMILCIGVLLCGIAALAMLSRRIMQARQ